MKDFQFSFDITSFNNLFPFYILIDKDLKIKSFGKSLKKILPVLKVDLIFTEVFSIQRPNIENLSSKNFNETIGKLVFFNSLIDNSVSLRGQIDLHNEYFLFIGTPWFQSMENVIEKKLILNDFAIFDPLLDLLHVLKNQEINNSELKELLDTVNTQRKKLKKDKEELNKLSLVASANKNGVVFTHPDGRIFWCNQAYLDLTGFSNDEVIGKTPVEVGLSNLSDKGQIKKLLTAFYEGEIFDIEIFHKHKTKKPFWSKTKGQPVFDNKGKIIQYFAIIENNTIEKEYNQKIIESENRLNSLIENLQSGVLLEDENRKIVVVNKKFCSMFHIPIEPEQMKGVDCVIAAKETQHFFKNSANFLVRIEEILNNKEKVIAEEIELVNGSVYERSFLPIYKDGKYAGHLWSYDDITIKKRYKESIEAERQKYSNIIANMNMGLLEVDNNDTVLFANQSFCDMSGFSLLDLLGNKASELLIENKNRQIVEEKNSIRTNGISDSYEITAKTKTGETKHWLISGAPNYNLNGNLIGSIGVHLDITEQKNLEIQKENLLQRLEKQNEQLNEYAQIVSHDLKSPLRSIHSLVTWIKEDNDKEFSEKTLQYLNLIEGKVEKMDNLIQGILTYSIVDSKDSFIESIDLNEVVENCISVLYIPDNITVKIESKFPIIKADKYRMQQVFQNLIGNAVKYIDKPIGIVSVGCLEKKNSYIFYIKDNGPGIPKKHQQKIFKIFQSYIQHESSNGIGLSIVKRIINNYNGSIFLESELTKGTTFYFTLPKS
ncbi:PAS domain S-box protein [Flavobacterium sp.]|uniref:PAS domain S-box protein n=1 Tax=Flavobacterium sp. TaxID=239 RepID=UPI003D2C9FD5